MKHCFDWFQHMEPSEKAFFIVELLGLAIALASLLLQLKGL